MGRKRKLYNLRAGIMCEMEKIIVLLEQITDYHCTELKANILAQIALEKSRKVSKMNEKIGLILKH